MADAAGRDPAGRGPKKDLFDIRTDIRRRRERSRRLPFIRDRSPNTGPVFFVACLPGPDPGPLTRPGLYPRLIWPYAVIRPQEGAGAKIVFNRIGYRRNRENAAAGSRTRQEGKRVFLSLLVSFFLYRFPYIDIHETYRNGRKEGRKQSYYVPISWKEGRQEGREEGKREGSREGRQQAGTTQGRERGKEDDAARKQWKSAAPRLALRADPCAAGCRDRRGRDRQQQQHAGRQAGRDRNRRTTGRRRRKAGRQAGRLPGPVNRREMLISRKFEGRKTPSRGPDPAGAGAGAGDTFRTGAGDPGPNTPPAPHPPSLF